jgi:hypothetical protein
MIKVLAALKMHANALSTGLGKSLNVVLVLNHPLKMKRKRDPDGCDFGGTYREGRNRVTVVNIKMNEMSPLHHDALDCFSQVGEVSGQNRRTNLDHER